MKSQITTLLQKLAPILPIFRRKLALLGIGLVVLGLGIGIFAMVTKDNTVALKNTSVEVKGNNKYAVKGEQTTEQPAQPQETTPQPTTTTPPPKNIPNTPQKKTESTPKPSTPKPSVPDTTIKPIQPTGQTAVTAITLSSAGSACGSQVFTYKYVIEMNYPNSGGQLYTEWQYEVDGNYQVLDLPSAPSYAFGAGTVKYYSDPSTAYTSLQYHFFPYRVRLHATSLGGVYSNWLTVPTKC